MPSEAELINNEVTASEDPEGMDMLIQILWNEVAKKRVTAMRLHANKKSQQALELEDVVENMQKQLDGLIRSQMNYVKYLKAIGKNNQAPKTSSELKNQKSSNGAIVQLVPKN